MKPFKTSIWLYVLFWLVLVLCSGVTRLYWSFRPKIEARVVEFSGAPYLLEVVSNLPDKSILEVRAWSEEDSFLGGGQFELTRGVGSFTIPIDWLINNSNLILGIVLDPSQNPTTVQKHLGSLGQSLFGNHVYQIEDRALIYFQLELEQSADDRQLARMLLDDGDFELAVQYFRKGLSVTQDIAQNYFLLGWSLLRQGTWDDESHKLALNSYRLAVSKSQDYFWRYEALDILRELEKHYRLRYEPIKPDKELTKQPKALVKSDGSRDFRLGTTYGELIRHYKLNALEEEGTKNFAVFEVPTEEVRLWFSRRSKKLRKILFYGTHYYVEPGIHRGLILPEVEQLVKKRLPLMVSRKVAFSEEGQLQKGYVFFRGTKILVDHLKKAGRVVPVDKIVGIEVSASIKKRAKSQENLRQ